MNTLKKVNGLFLSYSQSATIPPQFFLSECNGSLAKKWARFINKKVKLGPNTDTKHICDFTTYHSLFQLRFILIFLRTDEERMLVLFSTYRCPKMFFSCSSIYSIGTIEVVFLLLHKQSCEYIGIDFAASTPLVSQHVPIHSNLSDCDMYHLELVI